MTRRLIGQLTLSRRGDRLASPAPLAYLVVCCLLTSAHFAGWARAATSTADDCILDHCADKASPANPQEDDAGPAPPAPQPWHAPARAAPAGRGASGDFDFYVLALSWSPGFCRTPAAARAGSQCDPGAGLGFVVHGLWPQYEHGYPEDCPFGARAPSRIALQGDTGLYPSEGLARYEWRKHGVCSGKSPTDYFNDVRRAREAIIVPAPLQNAKADQSWTSIDIERAFLAANARLRPGMIGVACRQGALQEVRICFSKDLRDFRACPEVARRGCPIGPVSVPAAL
jgi:ribonuclease T2